MPHFLPVPRTIEHLSEVAGALWSTFLGHVWNELAQILLKLINNSSSDKPIAYPHLGHMDAP